MNNKAFAFAALLSVVGLSIVFGMVLGTRINAPQVALASPQEGAQPAARLAPAVLDKPGGFADVVERALPAVVAVANTQSEDNDRDNRREQFFRWFFGDPDDEGNPPPQRRSMGFGSGFIVSEDGYILTNNHVVDNARRIVVTLYDGEEVEARLIGTDPMIDLALLKIDGEGRRLTPLPIGDSENLRVGEWVIAIGSPLEFDNTVTLGIVSAKERRVPLESTDFSVAHFIQTDAAINFGNSGGPLLDAAGNVIGINTAIRRGQNAEGIGFALPIDDARRAMQQLIRTGEVKRGFLGISLGREIDHTTADYYGLDSPHGALIIGVNPGQPADRAGLRRNDIIRGVNGKKVRNNFELIQQISRLSPGDRVELEVFRDGKAINKEVRLTERNNETLALNREGESFRNDEPGEANRAEREGTGFGVKVENITDSVRRRIGLDEAINGVLVSAVEFNSPAGDEGIDTGMVIVSVNDTPTRNVTEWNEVVKPLRAGEAAKLEVIIPGGPAQPQMVFIRVPEE